jgi:general secretion pathway protein D
MIVLNFQGAEIESVARAFATILGRNIVVDPRVRGVISLSSDQPVRREAAWEQFLALVRLQGFAAVESGGVLKLVPEAEAKLQSTTVVEPGRPISGGQLVTQILRLNFENANNLLPVLRPLITPNNTITPGPNGQSLIITDYADNVARIGKIVTALDVAPTGDVEVIVLRHAVAADIASLAQRLGESSSSAAAAPGLPSVQQAGAEPGRVSVVADSRINALLIRGASASRLQMIRNLVDRLDQPSAPNANIWVVYLKHADATRMAQTLRAALAADGRTGGPAPSGSAAPSAAANAPAVAGGTQASTSAITPVGAVQTGGIIQADPASNALIITAPEPQYRQIRAVIDRLDVRRAQVYVESLIVEVSATRAAEFGIQWQGPIGRRGDQDVGLAGTNFGADGNNILSQQLRSANRQLPNAPGAGFTFGLLSRVNGIYALTAMARALESRGEANILSTPNIVTLDNEEARITVGQNVPFLTGQLTTTGGGVANPFQTIERRDVGIVLRVRPQIGTDGTVRMAVFQEVSNVAEVNANGPVTNRRAIETNVLVDDGQIVVIGGLLSDSFNQNRNQVPGAGDVPVLGWLFRNERRTAEKTNLLVFLRPVVLRSADGAEVLSNDRYDFIRAIQRDRQPEQSVVVPINEAPMLPPRQPTPTQPVPAGPPAPPAR